MKNKGILYGALIIIVLVIIGMSISNSNDERSNTNTEPNNNLPNENSEAIAPDENTQEINLDWKTIPLTDIATQETYTISDFEGKPVLLESFAVWCPTCTKQQLVTKEFHEEVGDDVISIGLNTDSNEDEEKILDHINSNGFDWRYSVSPSEMTDSLVEEFGLSVLSAPSVPLILICPDGAFSKFGSGVKKIPEIKEAIASC